jgi:hypothetical protein
MLLVTLGMTTMLVAPAVGKEKSNILVIWADDVGWFNPSCWNRGMMGYETPGLWDLAQRSKHQPHSTRKLVYYLDFGHKNCINDRCEDK